MKYTIIINEEDGEKWELHSTPSFNNAVEIALEHFANLGLIVQILEFGKLKVQFGF